MKVSAVGLGAMTLTSVAGSLVVVSPVAAQASTAESAAFACNQQGGATLSDGHEGRWTNSTNCEHLVDIACKNSSGHTTIWFSDNWHNPGTRFEHLCPSQSDTLTGYTNYYRNP